MKIYLYNPETGAYFGEYSTEEVPESDASLLAPLRTTTVAPPEGMQGRLLVFDAAAQCWEVRTPAETEEEPSPEPMAVGPVPQQRQVCYYTAALLIVAGFVLAVAALCDYGARFGALSGVALILGTVACMSIRERMLHPSRNTLLLKAVEFAALSLLAAGTFLDARHRGSFALSGNIPAVAAALIYVSHLLSSTRGPKRHSGPAETTSPRCSRL